VHESEVAPEVVAEAFVRQLFRAPPTEYSWTEAFWNPELSQFVADIEGVRGTQDEEIRAVLGPVMFIWLVTKAFFHFPADPAKMAVAYLQTKVGQIQPLVDQTVEEIRPLMQGKRDELAAARAELEDARARLDQLRSQGQETPDLEKSISESSRRSLEAERVWEAVEKKGLRAVGKHMRSARRRLRIPFAAVIVRTLFATLVVVIAELLKEEVFSGALGLLPATALAAGFYLIVEVTFVRGFLESRLDRLARSRTKSATDAAATDLANAFIYVARLRAGL
jgi:hypothetical protein